MAIIKAKPAAAVALTLTALLGLAACADPGARAATAPTPGSSTTAAGKTFNLEPEQDRFKVPSTTEPPRWFPTRSRLMASSQL
jgi:polar amino acid transport system substrate-binding protein